ncbi:SgcJ/EcaC family oxidoreductase [Rugamonas sp. FT82W]|uniref:SgcJ/EcaC family oxidoreductase n=1 Tax=Duganella vulcania TaxID=2692166 RepID=A0A845G802_9BURK|nr:SgcJ/EcaC family oxidoreductase [Duganella vulcania]MYM90823.1 SgcJ/EcaC family oxidoreductase [Duganella vulcania]
MRFPLELALLAALTTGPSPAQAAPSDDELAIQQAESRWQDAWNRHDMDALSSLFTDDADFVQVNGRRWVGPAEIKKNHALVHEMMFKDSVWTNLKLDVRFLKPDVAIAHQTWGLRGDRNPDGTPRTPREGLFTQVFVKRGDRWLISAAHNTNIAVVPGSPVAGSTPPK